MCELNLFCHYCDTVIQGNSIAICNCPLYFHSKCLKLYEKKQKLLIEQKCLICNKEYNIDFIDNYYIIIYKLTNILNDFFIYFLYFIYIIGLLTIIFNRDILFFFIFLYQIIINLYILFLDYKLRDVFKKRIIISIFISFILLLLNTFINDYWYYYTSIIFYNSILLKFKKDLYIYSTRYFYIECKNNSRINSNI